MKIIRVCTKQSQKTVQYKTVRKSMKKNKKAVQYKTVRKTAPSDKSFNKPVGRELSFVQET